MGENIFVVFFFREDGYIGSVETERDGGIPIYNVAAIGVLHVSQGKREKKSFTDWKVKGVPTEVLARDHLKRYGIEHYWDLALSESIMEQGQDD